MEISLAAISKQIYLVRDKQVMLDSDLAKHYQIETRILNQTVRSIEFSVLAVRAFAQMRQPSEIQNELGKKVDYLEHGFQELKQVSVRLESKIDTYLGPFYDRQQNSLIHTDRSETRRPVVFAHQFELDQIENILNIVGKYFGINIADLKLATRVKSIVLPRQIAIYLIRKRTGIGFKEIGKCLGGKDHTTILYAFRKISADLTKNGLIREYLEKIEVML